MAFTEKDMQAQEEQLNALKDKLSRLNQKFANFCRPDKAFVPHPAWTKRTLSAI